MLQSFDSDEQSISEDFIMKMLVLGTSTQLKDSKRQKKKHKGIKRSSKKVEQVKKIVK